MALIYHEFARLIEANQKELSLGEVVKLTKQLEQAGYIFNISRGINGEVNLNVEKSELIYLLRRIVATLTKKRLKLTHWQLYAYKQKAHYNYKRTLQWPGWVLRAISFEVRQSY